MTTNPTQLATHTPGPWIESGQHPSVDGSAVISIHDRTGELIAVLGYDDQSPAENSIANARLIAAIPELLKELQWLVKHPGVDVENARAALAKATGASQ